MLDTAFRAHGLRDLLVTGDVASVLERYLVGTLDEFGASLWAEPVHGCEDIVLEPASCDFLADALFQLSTPELFGTVSSIVESLWTRVPAAEL
ncbi:hypothetical protein [Paenarthrobacter sp. NPDC090522]|uniref:hypothetical protein n=1 Tax=Paenarthrobacter sp. NPDC090522 TaxID=3364383 RepID=UPI0037FB47FD